MEGRDYRFVSPLQFSRLVEEGAFLEWTEVFGQRYGTLWGPVADDLERGRNVILEIDVRGAAAVRERVPEAVLIFLAPPSDGELARRLLARHTESEADQARRLAAARNELEQARLFDHVVVNDRVEQATAHVAAIIEAASNER